MKPLRPILLVEDESKDIELTLAVMEAYGLADQVIVARNGAEALDYFYARGRFRGLTPGPPALVLLDINLPCLNGLEVLRQVRADPLYRTVPVVMLTSSRAQPDLVQSYELGANAYIVKPDDSRCFANAVRQVGLFWASLNDSVPQSLCGSPPPLSPQPVCAQAA